MSTAELKIDLIAQITGITDKVKLEEIMQLIKFQSDETIFVTTKDEKLAIQDARKQIAHGNSITNEDLQNEIQEWLKK